MNGKKKETITFSVTVPVELNEKLTRDAEDENRSKSQQVARIVKQHYESKELDKSALAY